MSSEVVFPNPKDTPTLATQFPRDHAVASPVPRKFFFPIGAAFCDMDRMFWAGVPKTAIDENYESLWSKSKVGSAYDALMPPPTVNMVTSKNVH
jgi:hypothetical protein